MPKKPTAVDAQIIMQLYDLRREPEMRKARSWFGGSFWPASAEEVMQVLTAFDKPENAWFRQVHGYWEMAASFVLRGVLNEELFFDNGGELWFVLAKVYPYLKEFRVKAQVPRYFQQAERLATRTKQGRERLHAMVKRQEAMRARAARAS